MSAVSLFFFIYDVRHHGLMFSGSIFALLLTVTFPLLHARAERRYRK
jgi:hypothetical protein